MQQVQEMVLNVSAFCDLWAPVDVLKVLRLVQFENLHVISNHP